MDWLDTPEEDSPASALQQVLANQARQYQTVSAAPDPNLNLEDIKLGPAAQESTFPQPAQPNTQSSVVNAPLQAVIQQQAAAQPSAGVGTQPTAQAQPKTPTKTAAQTQADIAMQLASQRGGGSTWFGTNIQAGQPGGFSSAGGGGAVGSVSGLGSGWGSGGGAGFSTRPSDGTPWG